MPNTNVPLGQFFTVGEQIELREALRMRLKDQIQWVDQFEFTTGIVSSEMRKSVRQIHSALLKVLEYRDDGEGLGFKDEEMHEFLNEVREEAA